MVYLKSILAGLAAVCGIVLLTVVGFIGWGWWMVHRAAPVEGVGAVSYEVNTPWIEIPMPLIVAVAFFAGFYWQYRRSSRANRATR